MTEVCSLPSLYEWQKPFAEMYGHDVRLHTKGGRILNGYLEPPKKGAYFLAPARSLFLHTKSGNRIKVPLDNVGKVEVIE